MMRAFELDELRHDLVAEACTGAAIQLQWVANFIAAGHVPQAKAAFERARSLCRTANEALREIEVGGAETPSTNRCNLHREDEGDVETSPTEAAA